MPLESIHHITVRFADPEGLGIELVVRNVPDPPLAARAPDVPEQHALQGFEGVRAYASDPAASTGLLEQALRFRSHGDGAYELPTHYESRREELARRLTRLRNPRQAEPAE